MKTPFKSRRSPLAVAVTSLLTFTLLHSGTAKADPSTEPNTWPQWRGPSLDGTAAEGSQPPLEWSETKNVRWKTPLPWWSGSTPIVWKDHIFLTTPASLAASASSAASAPADPPPAARSEEPRGPGRRRGGGGPPETGARLNPGGSSLLLLCLNRKDGSIRWTRPVDEGNSLHRKHNNTSPSPVTDGQHVWVLTGNGVLTCFDFDGETKWTRNLATEYGAFGQNHGYGSSPVLHDDRLIITVLHGSKTDKPSYLLAINKTSGANIWRTERRTPAQRESPDAYITPQLHHNKQADRIEVVVNGGDVVTGHDLKTGNELWRADVLNPNRAGNYRIVPSCLIVDDIIIAPTRENPMTALKAGGSGDVTKSHVLWQFSSGPDVPTPVSDGQYLWTISGSRSLLSCIELKTGKVLYDRERLPTGTYSSSPVIVGDRIYIPNESGSTIVVAASPEFKILATNTLNDAYTLSSPVIVGNEVFLRTGDHLYCLAEAERL